MEPIFKTLEVEEITDVYRVIKRLGQGTYGQVLLAQDRITGEPLAVKLVRKDRTKLKTFLMELSLSISLSEHPGIITTYPIFIGTMDYYLMTQEIATAGSLHHLIRAEVGIPEEAVKRCAIQISSALQYMHGRGLVHKDLKPDNVLIMDKGCHHVKLADFGLTQGVGCLVPAMNHIIPYMSPELCDLKDGEFLIVDPSIDTWALAVLLFVISTGYFPWKEAVETDKSYQKYLYWRTDSDHTPPPCNWEKFTREATLMLNNLLAQDPSSRHSVLSILSYINLPWKLSESEYKTYHKL